MNNKTFKIKDFSGAWEDRVRTFPINHFIIEYVDIWAIKSFFSAINDNAARALPEYIKRLPLSPFTFFFIENLSISSMKNC